CEGQLVLTPNATKVSTIRFDNMGKGRDIVEYDLVGELTSGNPGASRVIQGNLGAGNDTFTANVEAILASANLTFNVSGGADRDQLTLTLTADVFGTSQVVCLFQGDAGNDTLTFTGTSAPNQVTPGVDISLGSSVSVAFQGGDNRDKLQF